MLKTLKERYRGISFKTGRIHYETPATSGLDLGRSGAFSESNLLLQIA
jgi:hypothetical protein